VTPPYPHPLIAREGWLFVGIALVLALAVGGFIGWWWSAPIWLLAIFIVQFFRDPPRAVPDDPRAVVSPADGRIVEVSRARDPWLERDALKVSVFMNVFNVHSNRSPIDGTVRERWYFPGAFVNAALDKASDAQLVAGGRSHAASFDRLRHKVLRTEAVSQAKASCRESGRRRGNWPLCALRLHCRGRRGGLAVWRRTVLGGSAVQLQAFAAPKTSGLWDEVRQEIAEEVAKSGGDSEQADERGGRDPGATRGGGVRYRHRHRDECQSQRSNRLPTPRPRRHPRPRLRAAAGRR
jgi:hypothetical protein